MPHPLLALGRHLLFREIGQDHWIPILAVVLIVLLVRFWSPLVDRLGSWWRSR